MPDQFGRKSKNEQIIELAADIISAYVKNNPVPIGELPALIGDVHGALSGIKAGRLVQETEPQKPAVPIKKSVTLDYIISLENGQKFKSLKRHLKTAYGMTPEDYRAKWNLPADYPMVAPNYAAMRSQLARGAGLGLKPEPAPAAKLKGRKKTK